MWINGLLCSVGVRNNVIIIVVDARYHQAPILQWAIEIQLCSKKGMCCCYWSQVTFFRCGSLWSRCYTHNSKLLGKKQVTLGLRLHVSQMPFNLPICHCLCGFFLWLVSTQHSRHGMFQTNQCVSHRTLAASCTLPGNLAASLLRAHQPPHKGQQPSFSAGSCRVVAKVAVIVPERDMVPICANGPTLVIFQQPSPILELHPKCWSFSPQFLLCPCFLVQS